MPRQRWLTGPLTSHPLQASKLIGIVIGLLLGVGGVLRIISVAAVVDNPLLADGQFLGLVLVPLVGIGLVGIVILETAVTGYRILRSEDSVRTRAAGRLGYVLVRCLEAGVAIVGLLLIVTMGSALVAENTPAPVGVGLLFGLMAVGVAILLASLVRSVAELYWFDENE